jgi:DNA polymerase I-like protein with 3'-5' exonuclease and polymerase domains
MQLPLFVEHFPIDHAALDASLRAPAVAIDVETETRWPGWGPRHDYGLSYPADVTIIALAWSEQGTIQTTALTTPFDDSVHDFLVRLFTGSATIIAHNAVFDMRQLSKYTGGVLPRHIWDTMSMARLLHPSSQLRRYRLLDVADMLDVPYSERHVELKEWRSKLHELARPTAIEYAQEDTRLTFAIYEKQQALPADPELIDWEIRAVGEYARMAAQGILLNQPFVEQRRAELMQIKMDAAARLAQDGLSTPDSPKARVRYLYETKRIPLPDWDPDSPSFFTWGGYKRLSRADNPRVTLDDLSTRSNVIESYIEDESPYAEQLKDLAAYVRADWMISTLDTLVEHAALDGRVHSLITIATDTGRRASSNPAMQNWKMPDMAGIATAPEGFTLVEIDYSNAENVMAALLAADDNLAAACATEDFHSAMGEQYFGERWTNADDTARKHLRGMSKRISYGTAYGMGAKSLAKSLNVPLEEAYALLRTKDAVFAKLARARQLAEQKVRETSRLKLWSGRPIALSQPFVAWNYICQGGVGEMLKRAIVRISEEYAAQGLRSRVALDIHDALIIEVAHDEWDTALDIASTMMRTIVPETLRQRTTPPVDWIARPNPEENRRKWGKGQWHPGQ